MAFRDVQDAAPSGQARDTENLQYSTQETASTSPLRLEYAMNHKRRGKAVIINNKAFDYKKTRRGSRKESDVDAASLYTVFKSRRFDVKLCNNQTVAAMEKIFIELCKEDHSDADCFVLAILTHSEEDDIYGTDGRISLEECILPFKLCPTLAGRPKIFIVQTSLGGATVSDAEPVPSEEEPHDTSRDQMIPQQADVLTVFSSEPVTKPGEGKGARFVQAFKQVMGKNKPDQDFINVLTEANDLIASQLLAQGNDKIELPCVISTLTKKIIFPKK